ncbi:MAG TPA: phosphatase PAP2 family protein [Clostridia bacterium]|jgi:membrane-associated phospholipid phosphatase|nr:MAG: PAP2 superfamily protein [Firmicutes bacterium ADurb.Bin146]HOD93483.1 phosphatase PAP2 family protein [Clostridia bacterium]HQM39777.1 phosphatase PAP2 family protein [Clostridia bacterium]
MAVYWGTQFLVKKPHVIGNKLDEKIPFIPLFIFPYITWYIIMFALPFALYFFSIETYALYTMSLLMVLVISGIIYLVYPTTFVRPEPKGMDFSTKVVRFIYANDKKILSCMPSLHCSLSMLFILAAIDAEGLPLSIKISVILLSFLIILSTVFVKQHMLIDVITALPLSVICWYLAMAIGTDKFLIFFNFI